MAIIGILTDFGDRGQHYVAEMKGVALEINAGITLIDITHHITPYSVLEAAYVLFTVYDTFPKGTIFVSVVDPGVGSDRAIVAVQTTDGYYLVGPDNGIFSYFRKFHLIALTVEITEREFFYPPYRDVLDHASESQIFEMSPNDQNEFSDLNKPELTDLLSRNTTTLTPFPVPSTFQGRDVMIPCAAHLSQGLEIVALGHPITDLIGLPQLDPEVSDDHRFITAYIQYIDSFGNIITTIPIDELNLVNTRQTSLFCLHIHDLSVDMHKATIFYGANPDLYLFMEGSSGFMEICQNQGHAANHLHAQVGDSFQLEFLDVM